MRWDGERRTGDLVWCRRDKADAWHGLQVRFLTKSVVEMHNGGDSIDGLEYISVLRYGSIVEDEWI